MRTRQIHSNVLYRCKEPVITNLCVVEGEEAEHLHLLDGVDGACPGHVQQLSESLNDSLVTAYLDTCTSFTAV